MHELNAFLSQTLFHAKYFSGLNKMRDHEFLMKITIFYLQAIDFSVLLKVKTFLCNE